MPRREMPRHPSVITLDGDITPMAWCHAACYHAPLAWRHAKTAVEMIILPRIYYRADFLLGKLWRRRRSRISTPRLLFRSGILHNSSLGAANSIGI